MKHTATFLIMPLLALSLSGCATVILGGAAVGGTVAMQERTAGNALDDTGLELLVERNLLESTNGSLFTSIGVDVIERRALLTGSVKDPAAAVLAVEKAWAVDGIQEVVNEIQVNDSRSIGQRARDTWIEAQIKARLLGEEGLRSVNYNVESVHNVVYLIGIAQDETELNKALNIARTTRYVEKVVSHVRLKSDPLRKPYRG